MADLFISYAREDRARIEVLATALEAGGQSVWWDRRIVGGDAFAHQIERELDAAGAVIVVWSAAGARSNWVRDEAAVAAEAGKLIAISLDGSAPPMGFRQFHAIDFSNASERNDDPAFNALAHAVAVRLGDSTSLPPSTPSPLKPSPPSTSLAGSPAAGAPGKKAYGDSVPWIAVTSIKVRGDDPDMQDLADDLVDSFASGLARFSYLKVATHDSAAEAERAGARYILEGTLRQTGSRLRLSTRLRTTGSARQVWGEHYNRAFESDTIFELHDDLTDCVITAVADPYGALMRDLAAPVLEKAPEDMTPYEALIRHFVYRQRVTEEDHAIVSRAVELAVERAPGNADLWAALAFCYLEGYNNRYNEQTDAAQRALQCARRAVEIDPQSGYAQYALFHANFFTRDIPAARQAAQRALELNPRDTDAMVMTGILTMFLGDWDLGFKRVTRGMKINTNGPGWYWFGGFYHHYKRDEYDEALDYARRVDMPQYHAYHSTLAIALAECGQLEEARAEVDRFLALWPASMEAFVENIQRWFFAEPELRERFHQSLVKAGLEFSPDLWRTP
ncbi:MAG: TIR domain-containing protein [Gammaproteobacteria bacterium]